MSFCCTLLKIVYFLHFLKFEYIPLMPTEALRFTSIYVCMYCMPVSNACRGVCVCFSMEDRCSEFDKTCYICSRPIHTVESSRLLRTPINLFEIKLRSFKNLNLITFWCDFCCCFSQGIECTHDNKKFLSLFKTYERRYATQKWVS